MSDLKPCPFCGSTDIKETSMAYLFPMGSQYIDSYVCASCGCKAHQGHWNNRPYENKLKADAVREAVKHLNEYLRGLYNVSPPEFYEHEHVLMEYADKLEEGEL